MKKFEKFAKIFAYCLLMTGLIALACCYIFMTDRTYRAVNVVINYLNTPAFIVGGTTITVGLILWIIIKLVYDRFRDKIKKDLQETKDFNAQVVVDAKKYYEDVVKEKEEIIEILSSYQTQIDLFKDKLLKVCDVIPNAKVKAIKEEIDENYSAIKEEMNKKLNDIKVDVDRVIMEKNEIYAMSQKINILTETIERLEDKYGKEE